MLDKFKKVELTDKLELEKYLIECNRILCDYNFVNIYTWRDLYDTRWAILEDMPVIYNYVDDFILMPCSRCISFDSILKISDELIKQGKKGNFALMEKEFIETYNFEIQQKFNIELDEANADYIYSTQKLVDLRGKKLQKKKNLVSQFLRNNPDYQIKKLTKEYADDCFALAEKWCLQRDCEKLGFSHEKSALRKAFDFFIELAIDGLIILLNNKIIAFSVFSRQNNETYTIHYEKFDTEIKGTGQLINWETAKFLADKCKYINREQDMGLEGLRQAKKSYDPDFLVYTYKLFRK